MIDIGAEKAYNECYEQGRKNGWIPAGERLPEKCENVLLSTNGGFVEEGFYFETTEFHTIWKGFVTHGTYWDDEITAWQSLPNPYHAESEDK